VFKNSTERRLFQLTFDLLKLRRIGELFVKFADAKFCVETLLFGSVADRNCSKQLLSVRESSDNTSFNPSSIIRTSSTSSYARCFAMFYCLRVRIF
jgi:hypothetical protein